MEFCKLKSKRKVSIAIGVLLFLPALVFSQQFIAKDRFPLAPIPSYVTGVKTPVTELDTSWEINLSPSSTFWNDNMSEPAWQAIQVPGEPSMQGFALKHDEPFVYRKKINIPAVGNDKSIIIRFNGVYSHARVWVNGNFIREHTGGFTAWDCDITRYVKPGMEAWLHIEVTDKIDDISYASGYAHHLIGGILRKVELLILPGNHVQRLYADVSLDEQYQNGKICFNIATSKQTASSLIEYNLIDPAGKKVWEKKQRIALANGEAVKEIIVPNVQKWTAEDPVLYKLQVTLIQNNAAVEHIEQFLGFRKVEIKERAFLVNGKVTKLRGACRHDLHPLLGRSTNRELDSIDVRLAKEANMNFIRTSHYPPSSDFLEFCNRYGIYVQEETAVCFATYTNRSGLYKQHGGSHNDPAYTSQYLGQLSEMIDRDRNHPSVVMWSIGNESTYGINFQKQYDFVKTVDPSRPVSWSWPKSAVDSGKICFDIAVSHYPGYNGEKADYGGFIKGFEHENYPVLNDEWAHVACYPKGLLKYDPNVSDFWGQSLDVTWTKRFDVPSNIGGAIWGMIDEVFYLKDTVSGYGPWGFIDVWRRKKPEFWNVKKAYSPIRVLQTRWEEFKGGELKIPIKNRFDHTSLSSIQLRVIQDGHTTSMPLPDIKPHQEGTISVSLNNTGEQQALLQFIDKRGNMLDEEKLTWGRSPDKTGTADNIWKMDKKGGLLILKNSNNLEISLNTKNGHLNSVSLNNRQIITGGIKPIVNRPAKPADWYRPGEIFSGEYKTISTKIVKKKEKITVQTKGFVDNYPVYMSSTYFANGQVEINYSIDSIPEYTWQIGVEIPLSSSLDKIEWQRKGYWTTYPATHLSALKGQAQRFSINKEGYRVKPKHGIENDINNYYLAGTVSPDSASMGATQAYRATKENIYSYSVFNKLNSLNLTVVSDGSQAAKIKITNNGEQALQVLDQWAYWSLGWGNYEGEKNIRKKLNHTIRFSLINK